MASRRQNAYRVLALRTGAAAYDYRHMDEGRSPT